MSMEDGRRPIERYKEWIDNSGAGGRGYRAGGRSH